MRRRARSGELGACADLYVRVLRDTFTWVPADRHRAEDFPVAHAAQSRILSRLHFVVRVDPDKGVPDVDPAQVEAELAALVTRDAMIGTGLADTLPALVVLQALHGVNRQTEELIRLLPVGSFPSEVGFGADHLVGDAGLDLVTVGRQRRDDPPPRRARLERPQGVERPDDVQFAGVFRRRVAEDEGRLRKPGRAPERRPLTGATAWYRTTGQT